MENHTVREWAPISNTASLGEALAHIRAAADLDQQSLAAQVGTYRTNISHLENGHAVNQLELLMRIIRTLGYQLEMTKAPDAR